MKVLCRRVVLRTPILVDDVESFSRWVSRTERGQKASTLRGDVAVLRYGVVRMIYTSRFHPQSNGTRAKTNNDLRLMASID